MTLPAPVSAYAAVSKDGFINLTTCCREESGARDWRDAVGPRDGEVIPVTILPTEQYEAMVEALEIIAGRRQCLDNLMSNADVANAALAALKEQDHG